MCYWHKGSLPNLIFKSISKFRISNRLQVPILKPIASSDFQIDFSFRFQTDYPKKGEYDKMQNEITLKLKFKNYEFRRVKYMGGNPIIYTKKEWIGKKALIIPVPLTVTDRWIESHRKEDGTITINIPTDGDIITKKIMPHGRKQKPIGRAYVKQEWGGLDCLIIEAPHLDNF